MWGTHGALCQRVIMINIYIMESSYVLIIHMTEHPSTEPNIPTRGGEKGGMKGRGMEGRNGEKLRMKILTELESP